MKTPAEILMERSKAWRDILRPEQILSTSKIKEPVAMERLRQVIPNKRLP